MKKIDPVIIFGFIFLFVVITGAILLIFNIVNSRIFLSWIIVSTILMGFSSLVFRLKYSDMIANPDEREIEKHYIPNLKVIHSRSFGIILLVSGLLVGANLVFNLSTIYEKFLEIQFFSDFIKLFLLAGGFTLISFSFIGLGLMIFFKKTKMPEVHEVQKQWQDFSDENVKKAASFYKYYSIVIFVVVTIGVLVLSFKLIK